MVNMQIWARRVDPWFGKIPTRRGATKARVPQLLSLKTAATEAHVPRASAPQPEKDQDEKQLERSSARGN